MTHESTTLAPVHNNELAPLTPDQLVAQVNLIQSVMSRVMQDGEHYGVIPGCGLKKTLLKPGAEKLCMTFRLRPIIGMDDVTVTDMGEGHREYAVRCHLQNSLSEEVATGLGTCNTMESKYRYRSENTGQSVPKEYWDSRNSDLLGGSTFAPKKVNGKWMIMQKIEYDNPSDYYNTVLKMAKKRALVDATLSATAASDMFTQDLEDMGAVLPRDDMPPQPQAAPVRQPQRQSQNMPYSGIWTGRLAQVDVKTGTSKRGSWTLHTAVGDDGARFGTFSDTDANDLKAALETHSLVAIAYNTTARGTKNILSITPAEEPAT